MTIPFLQCIERL